MTPEQSDKQANNPVTGASSLSVLERRRIEAMVLGPMLRAFQEKFGAEETRKVARRVITEIARKQGRELAEFLGDDSLVAFAASKEPWRRGGSLEIEETERTPQEYSFNVTRCRYAEMYREMGYADLGEIFSCTRDFEFSLGFNSRIKLVRTQTIMQGAPFCDFRYRLEPEAGAEP